MPRKNHNADEHAAFLAFVRSFPEAKPLRAAALHYAAFRDTRGVDHVLTYDAEMNLYRQALALADAVRER